ncbi:MAG: hypothetical protein OEZ13_08255 [Spirochaetia bacterium]|nr:hypothetical protein [Spirochaetia bacterium]
MKKNKNLLIKEIRRNYTGFILILSMFVYACSQADIPISNPTDPLSDTKYTIGGTLNGLGSGLSVTLQNNGVDNLELTENGIFTFGTDHANLTEYNVSILKQPVNQTCTVSNGKGAINGQNVENISVSCSVNTYKIAGSITGLTAGGLILETNGITLNVDSTQTTFEFTGISNGANFNVIVNQHPANQYCTLTGNTGLVNLLDITDVAVACVNTYLVTGSFDTTGTGSGLADGLILQNNTLLTNETLNMTAGVSTFAFITRVPDGYQYNVSIYQNPAAQSCTVASGTGTISSADVNLTITCIDDTYTIGGAINGYSDSGLKLTLAINETPTETTAAIINTETTFSFTTGVTVGSSYAVTINTQPGGQTCSVSNGEGVMGVENIDNVSINCSTNTYSVSGSVGGYSGSGLVLQNNLGDDISITNVAGDETFTFGTVIPDGGSYDVTVKTQPTNPSQNCSVSNGTGTVPQYDNGDPETGNPIDVLDVSVTCVTNQFTVGGTIAGLNGNGLTLDLSADGGLITETLEMPNGATTFNFTSQIEDLKNYIVTVSQNPTSLSQVCSVINGSGNLSGANISAISVSCVTNQYTVSGNITGNLSGNVTLRFIGGAHNTTLVKSATGAFNFNAFPVNDGTSWIINVESVAGGGFCNASNNTGIISGANVTNVSVVCALATHKVAGIVSGLSGSGLVLKNNGGDNKSIGANGYFEFATQVAEGASYSVTVGTHPSGPLQLCSVSNGSGIMGTTDVTNVTVNCVADNAPTASISKYYGGSYDPNGNSYMVYVGGSSDDGGIASYTYYTSTSSCKWSNNSTSYSGTYYYSPAMTCTFDSTTYQSVIYVGVKVRVYDNRGQYTDSGYIYFYVYNNDYTFVKPGGTSSYGTDPDSPAGTMQNGVNGANSNGRHFVAVQSGTYTTGTADQYGVEMVAGISLLGNYNSTYSGRTIRSAATILDFKYTGAATGYAIYMSGSAYTSSTSVQGINIYTYTYNNRRAIYINGGSPLIQYNYIYEKYSTSSYSTYGIYCSSCTSKIEANLIDIENGYGIYITNTGPDIYNNIIRCDMRNPLVIFYTGTNWVDVINNTFINTYTSKSWIGAAVRMYGTSTSNVSRVRFYNNILYGMYSIYEDGAYADPYYTYNNDLYGPSGYSVYYDADGQCSYNYDGDNNAYTCGASDYYYCSVAGCGYRSAYIHVNPSIAYTTATTAMPEANMGSTNVDIKYGGRYWSDITYDWYNAVRTSNNPATGGSTLSNAYGWSMGADED